MSDVVDGVLRRDPTLGWTLVADNGETHIVLDDDWDGERAYIVRKQGRDRAWVLIEWVKP